MKASRLPPLPHQKTNNPNTRSNRIGALVIAKRPRIRNLFRMRLTCPTCPEDTRLKLRNEENQPMVHHCESCTGHWLSWDDYFEWLSKQEGQLPIRDDDTLDVTDEEMAKAKICPECQVILVRYRIGHGTSFQLDYCRRCNGVWFDAREWEAVRSKNLHDKVNTFFTRAWQNSVRHEATSNRLNDMFRRRLGDADYRRVASFKKWLDTQRAKGQILAYLQEMPGNDSFPKAMQAELRQIRN